MDDFNRKVEDASARVGHTINEAAERLEKEIPEFIKYLNDEVVPAVRTHSTKALRVASAKLAEFANYMEQQRPPK
jgi:glutamyl-tRNA reductase